MQFHRARRRLVDGWNNHDADTLYKDTIQHLKNLASKTPGMQADLDAAFDFENHKIGMDFKPFNTHNYLYGFDMREKFREVYELVNNPSHPKFKEVRVEADKILATYRKWKGPTLPEEAWTVKNDNGLRFVKTEFGLNGMFVLACDRRNGFDPTYNHAVLGAYAIEMASVLILASKSAFVLAPLFLLGQVAVSGWQKTLWTWGVGIGATESASYFNQKDDGTRLVSGWSIISYSIFGHFFMELWKRPKLRKIANLFKYPEFISLSIGGFGAFSAVSSMIMDPGYPNGKSLGTGHAYHHMGILLGAYLNR